jgi:hypothetical protein
LPQQLYDENEKADEKGRHQVFQKGLCNENIQLFYVKPGKFHIVIFDATLCCLYGLVICIMHRKPQFQSVIAVSCANLA